MVRKRMCRVWSPQEGTAVVSKVYVPGTPAKEVLRRGLWMEHLSAVDVEVLWRSF